MDISSYVSSLLLRLYIYHKHILLDKVALLDNGPQKLVLLSVFEN